MYNGQGRLYKLTNRMLFKTVFPKMNYNKEDKMLIYDSKRHKSSQWYIYIVHVRKPGTVISSMQIYATSFLITLMLSGQTHANPSLNEATLREMDK